MCLALGCIDQKVTQPPQVTPTAPALLATTIGSYTVTLPVNNTGSASGLPQFWVASGGVTPTNAVSIPAGTVFRVKVSGAVSVGNNPQAERDFGKGCCTYPTAGTYGPLGTGGTNNELRVYVDLRDPNGNVVQISLSADTLPNTAISGLYYSASGGSIWVGHAGVTGGIGNGTTYDGLYSLDGGRTVTVEKITNVVTLTASPSRVRANTRVVFTAATADSTIPWHTSSWEWTPDVGTYWNPPCYGYQNPCAIGVGSSGTMKVTAYSGNAPFIATARVTVYSSFTLDADKTSLPAGDSVIFTPKLDGVKSAVARWLWRGDDASVVTAPCAPETDTCVRQPISSGTMWAYTAATGGDSALKHVTVTPPSFSLTSSTNFVHAEGDTVSFSVAAGASPLVVNGWRFVPDPTPTDSGFPPEGDRLTLSQRQLSRHSTGVMRSPTNASLDIADGSTFQDCAPGTSNCVPFISSSGWLRVSGTVAGFARVDSAHVYVDTPIDSLAVEPPNVRYQCPPDYGETWIPWTMTSTTGVPVLIQPPLYRIPGEIFKDAGTFDADYKGIPWAKYKPLLAVTGDIPPKVAEAELFYVCKTWVIGESPSGKLLWGGRLISEGGKVTLP